MLQGFVGGEGVVVVVDANFTNFMRGVFPIFILLAFHKGLYIKNLLV